MGAAVKWKVSSDFLGPSCPDDKRPKNITLLIILLAVINQIAPYRPSVAAFIARRGAQLVVKGQDGESGRGIGCAESRTASQIKRPDRKKTVVAAVHLHFAQVVGV